LPILLISEIGECHSFSFPFLDGSKFSKTHYLNLFIGGSSFFNSKNIEKA